MTVKNELSPSQFFSIKYSQLDGKTRLRSMSGRLTEPLPRYATADSRSHQTFWRKWFSWLFAEAYAEAQQERDTFHSILFYQAFWRVKNGKFKFACPYPVNEWEVETAQQYLFGDRRVIVDLLFEPQNLERDK